MLVVGHADYRVITELGRSQPVDGEVGERDMRNNYEPQQHSLSIEVTPVARERPPFAPNHRLAVPTLRTSVRHQPSLTKVGFHLPIGKQRLHIRVVQLASA